MLFLKTLAIFILVIAAAISIAFILDPKETSDELKEIFSRKYNIEDEMHLFDEAEWVKKVILSCKTSDQIWNAYHLSEILYKKYNKKVNHKIVRLVSDSISKVFNLQLNRI